MKLASLDRASQRVASFLVRGSNFVRRICDVAFYRVAFWIAAIERGGVGVAVVFPQPMESKYTIWKTCTLLGLRIVSEWQPSPEIAVYWEDTTVSDSADDIPGLINAGCTDIGKDVVEQRFAEVFGYPLAVDIAMHIGPYVQKSRQNFAHDGTVLNGSVGWREADCVYERLIDNTLDEGWQVLDIRTPVVGNRIPVIFLLYRSITDRFGTDSLRCKLVNPESVFTAPERKRILAMTRAMGLDYGELDVLRDASDGRIYVVDVNKTPVGPPRPLSLGERHRAMRLIAKAFAAEFLVCGYGTAQNRSSREVSLSSFRSKN
jgi:hypothetical protein